MSRSDYLVERAHLGEATPEEEAELRQDPRLVQRVQELAEADAAFHARFPVQEQQQAIQRKLHLAETRAAVSRRNRLVGTAGILVPLAALATVMLVAPDLIVGASDAPMDSRSKGLENPTLAVHRRADGQGKPEPLQPGAVASPGDELQLSYRRGTATHGVIVSVDGLGTVSLHHPEDVSGDSSLTSGGFVELPHAYGLDDAPRYERFFFVTDDEPVDARAVLRAARALPVGEATSVPLEIQADWTQTSFLLRKVDR